MQYMREAGQQEAGNKEMQHREESAQQEAGNRETQHKRKMGQQKAGKPVQGKSRLNQAVYAGFGSVILLCIALCLFRIGRLQERVREQSELLTTINSSLTALQAELELDTVRVISEGGDGVSPATSDQEDTDDRAGAKDSVKPAQEGYADKVGLEEVEKPKDRSRSEILDRLEELGETSLLIGGICDNISAYPKKMLEALANNPEMADFVSGWPTAKKRVSGGLTEAEKEQEFPLFLQWDPRWGYMSYGNGSCMGLSGCGPTCLSMVLYYLTGDETITPAVAGRYSMDNGHYKAGTGTAWTLMEALPEEYDVNVWQPDITERGLKAVLDEEAVVILSMGPGDFTVGGHFIVVYGYDREGFLINDPNCVARSRKKWNYSEIEKQIKHMWVFSQKETLEYYEDMITDVKQAKKDAGK